MKSAHYSREFEKVLAKRLLEEPRFIQVVMGPRQVGKTSGVLEVLRTRFPKVQFEYHACDEEPREADWFSYQVQKSMAKKTRILVFDEIQKLENWADHVKSAWDVSMRQEKRFHLVLLGSSSLQLTQGLSDSLAGRFEVIPAHHWAAAESRVVSGMSLEEYLRFGGYPASYAFRGDSARFRKYVFDSIFETVVNRDILRFATVKKPALFRQTFGLACQYPAQEVSYNKLLGQLQDAGNVDQIKHYLDLFSQAFLIRLLFKWSKTPLSRTSSPKLLPCVPVFSQLFHGDQRSAEFQGRVFESVVGNRLCERFESVHFWREGGDEVDFVVAQGASLVALEVKSTRRKSAGVAAFRRKFKGAGVAYVDFETYPEFEKNPAAYLEKFAT